MKEALKKSKYFWMGYAMAIPFVTILSTTPLKTFLIVTAVDILVYALLTIVCATILL